MNLDLGDIFALFGLMIMTFGIAILSIPIALIISGAILFCIGIALARNKGGEK